MKPPYPTLFSPLQIGAVTVRNRIEVCPVSPSHLGPNYEHYRHAVAMYEAFAKGGAGLVTVGEAAVNAFGAKTHGEQLTILSPECDAYLSELADAIASHGGVASIEVNSGGFKSPAACNHGVVPLGPCAGTLPDGEKYEAMTEGQMDEIADVWAEAVVKLKRLGFGMAMLHCGHGWQIAQFLSPLWNQRTDEYGGSLENRARFPLRVIERIRSKVGRQFPLCIRVSGDELVPGGSTLSDCIGFVRMVQDKVDICHVSMAYPFAPSYRMVMPSFYERGLNLPLAEEVKRNVGIPVSSVGAYNDPQMMEDALASGKIDMVAMGRALIADPELPIKALAGRNQEINHCIRCYSCVEYPFSRGVRRCSVNPVWGKEYESKFCAPSTTGKNVLVIGGGPAGLKAAVTAADRGHRVTLVEKSGQLGGALRYADHVSFKTDIRIFRDNLISAVNSRDIRVILGQEATCDLVQEADPDRLIVAIGAEPIVPPIPGVDGGNVQLAGEIFETRDRLGSRIVIIGGGLLGCESAVHLASDGKDVTVVEQLGELAPDGHADHRMMLLDLLQASAAVRLHTKCIGIDDGGVLIETDAGRDHLDADTVVLAVGYKPLRALADTFRPTVYDTRVVGDALSAGTIFNAIHGGYHAAMDL